MRNAPPPARRDEPAEKLSPAGMVATGATAQLAAAAAKAPQGPDIAPVGDRTRKLRLWIAYGLMIAYALFMFVPFSWTVVTSFKIRADALNLELIPNPISLAGWQY